MKELTNKELQFLKNQGVDYGDIRVVDTIIENISTDYYSDFGEENNK